MNGYTLTQQQKDQNLADAAQQTADMAERGAANDRKGYWMIALLVVSLLMVGYAFFSKGGLLRK